MSPLERKRSHVSPAREPEWSSSRPDSQPSDEQLRAERELELLDRVIGLEQQIRELKSANLLSPSEVVAVERTMAHMQTSLTWRAGRLVTLPIRAARYAKRTLLG